MHIDLQTGNFALLELDILYSRFFAFYVFFGLEVFYSGFSAFFALFGFETFTHGFSRALILHSHFVCFYDFENVTNGVHVFSFIRNDDRNC